MLDSILEYSKVEAGKLELELVRFGLARQVTTVAALLAPQFQRKGVQLATNLDPAAPVDVVGDPERLRQILINLVGNALKFTPPGGRVELNVTVTPGSEEWVTAHFTIVDTGIGIAPEALERLFHRFSQADASTTRLNGDTGMGLSISAHVVELMGGTIGVTSAPGAGSSFWFAVPFGLAEPGDGSEIAFAAPSGRPGITALDRRSKILVADDNEINMRVAAEQFRQLGFEITTAANGHEALAAFQRESFDIVFMDCRMPGMDGYAATREIRQLERGTLRRVPIVALTADGRSENRDACISAGMDDYLAKPAGLEDIKAILNRWLGGRVALETAWSGNVPAPRGHENGADSSALSQESAVP